LEVADYAVGVVASECCCSETVISFCQSHNYLSRHKVSPLFAQYQIILHVLIPYFTDSVVGRHKLYEYVNE